jgi:hypothetical protein
MPSFIVFWLPFSLGSRCLTGFSAMLEQGEKHALLLQETTVDKSLRGF